MAERGWIIRKNTGAERPFDAVPASIIGPDTEPVTVVPESRLRDLEAEVVGLRADNEGLRKALRYVEKGLRDLNTGRRRNFGVTRNLEERARAALGSTTERET